MRWLWVLAFALVAGCGGGDRISSSDLPSAPAALRVTSPAFIDGSRLPKKYTCDGAGEEPAVQAGATPVGTSELVVVVSDPDAPSGTFVHLTRYGLSPRGKAPVSEGGSEGLNSTGKTGWTPPCPPSGTHRYIWTVYALKDPSGLKPGAKPADVIAALQKGVLARGTITARYAR
jgi:Raf kinase inhibitor-like YbhB/YbcL family protein